MAETQEIIAYLDSLAYTHGKRDLAGKHLLITAGGTREYWDTVRFIGNPATGKMGIALARAALHRGAKVTLIYGAIAEPIPAQVRAIQAISSEAMCKAVLEVWPEADWLVMAAAVGDVRPAQQWSGKLPKSELPTALPLSPGARYFASGGSDAPTPPTSDWFCCPNGGYCNARPRKARTQGLGFDSCQCGGSSRWWLWQ